MEKFDKYSYSAANVYPIKVLLNEELVKHIKETGKIPIIHVQLNPTNKCNFNCPYCSCKARDRRLELSYEDIMEIMTKARKCGCQSTTVTGGGEPLMHPRIEEILDGIHKLDIEIGLVTNGTLLWSLSASTLNKMIWCRISSSDYLEDQLETIDSTLDDWLNVIEDAVERGRNVDWAFSHVVTEKPNFKIMKRIIEFANEHDFTHVRLVSDLLNLEKVPSMAIIKKKLRKLGVDDSKVNYQARKKFTRGTRNCYISILKPVITPRGTIQPCCGVQYRLEKPTLDYDPDADMKYPAKQIDRLYEEQAFFDGSQCYRCYYSAYNEVLSILLRGVKHLRFV